MMVRVSLIVCIFLCIGVSVRAQERVLNFHSDIIIDQQGRVTVTERIKVHAESQQIEHGIVRFIPLYRTDKMGVGKKIDFVITAVQKNGQDEPYHTEEDAGMRKIFVGSGDTFLPPDDYEYTITYQSRGHVGFFDTYDELYWNVTGDQWDFRIDRASATIHFPPGAKAGNTACYTGVKGSKNSYCSSEINADGSVTFHAGGGFDPGEGFTVAAAFTPNIIQRPGKWEMLYTDYQLFIFCCTMVIVFGLLFYVIWRRYGKDPVMPVIVPSFHIPRNWSPAAIRYFYSKTYDNKSVAVAFINIAVKGCMKISSAGKSNSSYTFEKTGTDTSVLSADEKSLYDRLFQSRTSIDTKVQYAATFEAARADFHGTLKKEVKLSKYFTRNAFKCVLLALLTLGAILAFLIYFGYQDGFPILFALPFLAIGLLILYSSFKTFKRSFFAGLFTFIFGAVFTGAPLFVGIHFMVMLPTILIGMMVILVVMYILLVYNMGAYTPEGIAIQSEIEGFRMYLGTAEEHRLNLLNPPERTPAVFEKFLPYAIALDVENEWGAKFESVLRETEYHADWYDNPRMTYIHFTSNVPTSFYSAVQVSQPSSSSGSSSGSSSWSSGSSGGGSSGGGGGGGGGGGW